MSSPKLESAKLESSSTEPTPKKYPVLVISGSHGMDCRYIISKNTTRPDSYTLVNWKLSVEEPSPGGKGSPGQKGKSQEPKVTFQRLGRVRLTKKALQEYMTEVLHCSDCHVLFSLYTSREKTQGSEPFFRSSTGVFIQKVFSLDEVYFTLFPEKDKNWFEERDRDDTDNVYEFPTGLRHRMMKKFEELGIAQLCRFLEMIEEVEAY